jgi:hypothetical protein
LPIVKLPIVKLPIVKLPIVKLPIVKLLTFIMPNSWKRHIADSQTPNWLFQTIPDYVALAPPDSPPKALEGSFLSEFSCLQKKLAPTDKLACCYSWRLLAKLAHTYARVGACSSFKKLALGARLRH